MEELDQKIQELDNQIATFERKAVEEMTEAELLKERQRQDQEFMRDINSKLEEIRRLKGEEKNDQE